VVYGAGLEVYTALDLVAQVRTEKIAKERVPYLERVLGRPKEPALQTAMPLLDTSTGALVAVYGGTMATSTDFGRATQAYRQAGSSFKPLVYALAFDTKTRWLARVHRGRRDAELAAQLRGHGRMAPGNVGASTRRLRVPRTARVSQNIATASLLEESGAQ
jgi:penicillin-binding protein 1A